MDLAFEREPVRHLRIVVGDNRTVVISTHRYSLLSPVDRLIVLDQDRITADGQKDKVLEVLQRKAKAVGQETGWPISRLAPAVKSVRRPAIAP